MAHHPDRDATYFQALGEGTLPGLLGIRVTEVGDGFLKAELPIRRDLFAPNGFLHGGTLVALADTAAGYACLAMLPEGATSFTTLELKTNFVGTVREGTLLCEARSVHLGRTTQVWDATVSAAGGKTLAAFRCTQLIIYPR
jgi:1,4-dihydroxy-2-naphthoyl-CoA hydrolase